MNDKQQNYFRIKPKTRFATKDDPAPPGATRHYFTSLGDGVDTSDASKMELQYRAEGYPVTSLKYNVAEQTYFRLGEQDFYIECRTYPVEKHIPWGHWWIRDLDKLGPFPSCQEAKDALADYLAKQEHDKE